MIHGLPDTSVEYVPSFLTGYNVVPVFVCADKFDNTQSALAAIEGLKGEFPANTRFVLKRITIDYVEVFAKS
jgi:hypothetical protein